jgi:hypothetical protein
MPSQRLPLPSPHAAAAAFAVPHGNGAATAFNEEITLSFNVLIIL